MKQHVSYESNEEDTDLSGLRTGEGYYNWYHPYLQNYFGLFFRDSLHGEGYYRCSEGIAFEGLFFANRKEGYGLVSFSDNSTFEGLYKNDKRFGPGVFKNHDGREDVGIWYNNKLIRLCEKIDGVHKLAPNEKAKYYLTYQKTIIEVDEPVNDIAKDVLSAVCASASTLKRTNELYSSEVMDYRSQTFDQKSFSENLFRKQITDSTPKSLIAWNDSQLMIEIMQHTYKYRMFEPMLSFCVVCLLKNKRTLFRIAGNKEIASYEFLRACARGDIEVVMNTFREHDLYSDVADSCGNTGVMFASEIDNQNIINFLLDQGADVNNTNDEGLTPFSICVL